MKKVLITTGIISATVLAIIMFIGLTTYFRNKNTAVKNVASSQTMAMDKSVVNSLKSLGLSELNSANVENFDYVFSVFQDKEHAIQFLSNDGKILYTVKFDQKQTTGGEYLSSTAIYEETTSGEKLIKKFNALATPNRGLTESHFADIKIKLQNAILKLYSNSKASL